MASDGVEKVGKNPVSIQRSSSHFSNGTSQNVRAVMPLVPKIRSFWFQLGPG